MTYTTVSEATVTEVNGRYMVLHPSNGVILAYCDTRREADAIVSLFNALDTLLHRVQGDE